MGDLGDYWRDAKEHKKARQNAYEGNISAIIDEITTHPECKRAGDHWRLLGEWDFWWTGTVLNIKTKKRISMEDLYVIYHNSLVI